jgi:hypothetical protein
MMTPDQIELARHALGLPNPRRRSYRNHYVVGEGCADYDRWTEMVAEGNARKRAGSPISGGDPIFWLTQDGATAALKRGEKLNAEDFPGELVALREV